MFELKLCSCLQGNISMYLFFLRFSGSLATSVDGRFSRMFFSVSAARASHSFEHPLFWVWSHRSKSNPSLYRIWQSSWRCCIRFCRFHRWIRMYSVRFDRFVACLCLCSRTYMWPFWWIYYLTLVLSDRIRFLHFCFLAE